MGEVEIVVKVPEGVPKDVVERIVERGINTALRVRKYFGIARSKKPVDELLKEAENAWIE